jgi:hypothetical protein
MSAGFHKLIILNFKYVVTISESEDGCLRGGVFDTLAEQYVFFLPNIGRIESYTSCGLPSLDPLIFLSPSKASSYVAVTRFSCLRLHLCGFMKNIFMRYSALASCFSKTYFHSRNGHYGVDEHSE